MTFQIRTRRASLLQMAAHAHRTGDPFPSLEQIADEWETPTRTPSAYLRTLRKRGVLVTKKRGRRIYVVEVAA